MGTFSNGEGGLSIRNKINAVITTVEATTPATIKVDYESNDDTNAFTDAEKALLTGVSTNIQTQIDGKLTAANNLSDIGNAATAVANLGITATASELNALDGITATTAELNYTSGVTSAIQTQIDTRTAKVVFDTAADLLGDATLDYTDVATGDYLWTREEGFSYKVAASGAVDHHLTTGGAVKLYVQPDQNGYNVKAFGSVGDDLTDDTAAFDLCLAACRTDTKQMYIPAGNYLLTSPLAVGKSIAIRGESVGVTKLKPSFASAGFLFSFNAADSATHVSDLYVVGPANYDANTKFLTSNPSYNLRFSNLRLNNLGAGLDLTDAWGTYIREVRAQYTENPIKVTKFNGSTIRDVYIQRYRGIGVNIADGLAPVLNGLTIEYGEVGGAGPHAIRLQATQSALIDGLYTEGGVGTDIHLYFKNQRACVNTVIRNCWFNSEGSKIIWAQSYRGLELDNIVLQTPVATKLIDFTSESHSAGRVLVGHVVQVDQNANGLLNDVRDTGQTLIPLTASNNKGKVLVTKPHPSVGNGTDADLTNISNFTVKDSNGDLPRVRGSNNLGVAAAQSDLTATSSSTINVFGAESAEITIYAEHYGLLELYLDGAVTTSGSYPTFTDFRLTNSTTGDSQQSGVKSTGGSGSTYALSLYINVQPGVNKISLAITKAQGGGGINVYTPSELILVNA